MLKLTSYQLRDILLALDEFIPFLNVEKLRIEEFKHAFKFEVYLIGT